MDFLLEKFRIWYQNVQYILDFLNPLQYHIVMTARSQSSHGFFRVRHFRSPVYKDFFSVFGYILSR